MTLMEITDTLCSMKRQRLNRIVTLVICCWMLGCASHQAAQPVETPPTSPAEPGSTDATPPTQAPFVLPITAPGTTTGRLKAKEGESAEAWFKVAPTPGKVLTFALRADSDLVLAFKDSSGEPIFYTMDGDQYPDFPGDDGVMIGVVSKEGAGAGNYEFAIGFRE